MEKVSKKQARYLQDKSTLDKLQKDLCTIEDLQILNILPENYLKWYKEKNEEIKDNKHETYENIENINLIWDEGLKDYVSTEKEWIVENLIPTKSVCILTGKRGTLKTFFALQMIYSNRFYFFCISIF